MQPEASFRGELGGRRLQGKRKKEKKEKRKKEKKREKERRELQMTSNYYIGIKCCIFQFFNSPVALKNKNKFAPQEKVEMTPLHAAKV